jgi:hypothetical protein
MSKPKRHIPWMDGSDDPGWWPPHVQAIFTAIGEAMGDKRLHPETLNSVSSTFGSILSGHQVIIEHVPARDVGGRKGRYRITVEGPAFGGRWQFWSGKLEKLSRAAANKDKAVRSAN